jgi:hypothetical protein
MCSGFILDTSVDRFLLPIALASHLLEEFANCTPTAEEKKPIHFVGGICKLYSNSRGKKPL